MLRVGIVGCGVVGKTLEQLFSKRYEVALYDKHHPAYSTDSHRDAVNEAELKFLAVPTPTFQDGSCDLSAIHDALSWVTGLVCIKSTIAPGTTKDLNRLYGARISFSPEFVGETLFHPYRDAYCRDLVAVGGADVSNASTISAYQAVLGPEPRYFVADSTTVELAKYMENCFFATKVAFVSQFAQLATLLGADFTIAREIWLADSRIGRSHSAVIDGPGFGGKCLPKDMACIIGAARAKGGAAMFLEAVQSYNDSLRAAQTINSILVSAGGARPTSAAE